MQEIRSSSYENGVAREQMIVTYGKDSDGNLEISSVQGITNTGIDTSGNVRESEITTYYTAVVEDGIEVKTLKHPDHEKETFTVLC